MKTKPVSYTALLLLVSRILMMARSEQLNDDPISNSCATPSMPTNGQVSCVSVHISGEDSQLLCTYTCDSGYKFKGLSDTSISRLCSNAVFTDGLDPPQCISVCSDPEIPAFVSLSCEGNITNKLTCKAHCQTSYRFEVEPEGDYVCPAGGNWFPELSSVPRCFRNQETLLNPGISVCAAWGRDHYRTFDNTIYTFKGHCKYVLAYVPNTFSIMVVNDPLCTNSINCKRGVEIYFGENSVVLRSTQNGSVVLWNNEVFPVPGSHGGTVIEKVGSYITVRSSLKFSLKWDASQSVFIKVSDELKGQVSGLCGRFNGDPADDFENDKGNVVTSVASFATSWKKTELNAEMCGDSVQTLGCHINTPEKSSLKMLAKSKCGDLLRDGKLKQCHKFVDPGPYLEACMDDCCERNTSECVCASIEAYSRACLEQGLKVSWRRPGQCEVHCPGAMVYKECGSSCVPDCSNMDAGCSDPICVDGCFCPDGWVLHKGQCIESNQCPCTHGSAEYEHGSIINEECNSCSCVLGKWNCTHKDCDAVCSIMGDPHFSTFDGRRYDFMGLCSYYLVQTPDFNIVVDSIRCGNGEAACTKSLSIDFKGLTIKLDHNHQLIINGDEIVNLPYQSPAVQIFMVSSLFMQVVLSNGISVMWDGRTRAYIKVPPTLKGHTQGLCGTYDGRQNNDFLTPQGSIESNINLFGNMWKTIQDCEDVPPTISAAPCETQSQRKVQATQLCGQLKGSVFEACHDLEDVTQYYTDCMYDLCSCAENIQDCLCPSLATYADVCAAKGAKINWRQQVKECMLQCPGGQVYQVCGRPCEHTCHTLAQNSDSLCDLKCVEGCSCPEGQSLNDHGECVSIDQCPCAFDGYEYPAGFTTLKGTDLCVCTKAQWQCSRIQADNQNITRVKSLCPENMEYSSCASSCPVTCENVESALTCDRNEDCQPGCVCRIGYVFDGNKCILPSMCPCYHGGKTYYEGDTFYVDCNECVCKSRKWQCENNDCPSTCSAYGDSHYTSFDGRIFEFQGSCDYIMTKSSADNSQKFLITTTNLQCGTSGVACSKGIEFTSGTEGTASFYRLQLVKGKSVIPDPGSPFSVREIGEMMYVTTPFGVSIQWDKGTRVYVRLSTLHIGKVEGLCGNFNGDQKDDFQMRSGGLPVAKATSFGDSWRVHSTCETSKEIVDTCLLAPQRRSWAQHRCSVIASDLFKSCHTLVDPKDYISRCEFDACGCDMGGDCECLCTAIAAYAHECANQGMPIKWRSKDLCGLTCSDCKAYNPCISVCPKETCDNSHNYSRIADSCENEDLCFEGCDFHACPEGQVYDSLVEPVNCIPRPLCASPSCIVGEKNYRDGERIDNPSVCNPECEICICRHGHIEHISYGTCTANTKGYLLTSPAPPRTMPAVVCTQSGWTGWMSSSVPTHANVGDRESLPGLRAKYTFCHDSQITDIRCRVISQPEYGMYFGQTVTCDLKSGLVCHHKDQAEGLCLDYEVSFYCRCDSTTTSSEKPPSSTHSVLSTSFERCNWTQWMNSDNVSNQGDIESIGNLRLKYTFCEYPTDIICRTVPDVHNLRGIRYDQAGQMAVTCDLNRGLVCLNSAQVSGQSCFDYEVSVLCGDECTSVTTPVTPSTGIRNTSVSSSTLPPSITTHISSRPTVDFTSTASSTAHLSMSTFGQTFDASTSYPTTAGSEVTTIRQTSTSDNSSVTFVNTQLYSGTSTTAIYNYTSTAGQKTPPSTVHLNSTHGTEKTTAGSFPPTSSTVATTKELSTQRLTDHTPCSPVNRKGKVCVMIGVSNQLLISNDQLEASSSEDAAFDAHNGRLRNKPSGPSNGGAWKPRASDHTPHLIIDFKDLREVDGIATQGRPDFPEWVKSYTVYICKDGVNFSPYHACDSDTAKVFVANNDSNSVAEAFFDRKMWVRKIAIYPIDYVNAIAMRVDLLMCHDTPLTTQEVNTSTHEASTSYSSASPNASTDSRSTGYPDVTSTLATTVSSTFEETTANSATSKQQTSSSSPLYITEESTSSVTEVKSSTLETSTSYQTSSIASTGTSSTTHPNVTSTLDVTKSSTSEETTAPSATSATSKWQTSSSSLPDITEKSTSSVTDKDKTTKQYITTTPIGSTVNTKCQWSDWLNADRPNSSLSDSGDLETIEVLKRKFSFCPDIRDIECRVAGSATSALNAGQTGVKCDIFNGLRCYNKETVSGLCYDYEVRLCLDSHTCKGFTERTDTTTVATTPFYSSTVVCPPGGEWEPCAYKCGEVCHSMGHAAGACSEPSLQECVPGCRSASPKCPKGQRLLGQNSCVNTMACTCLKPDGTAAMPFESWMDSVNSCSRCYCFNNEVVCVPEYGCTSEETSTVPTENITTVGRTEKMHTEETSETTPAAGTTKPSQTAGTDKVTRDVGTTKPTQTERTTEPTQTAGTTEATQTAGTDKVTRGVGTTKPTQTEGTTEPTQTAGTDKVTRGVGTTKPTQTDGTTEATQTAGTDKVTRGVGTTKPTQTAETDKVTRGVGTTKPTQTEGTTEATQTVGTTEATQTAGTDKVTRGVETTKPTQTDGTTEATQTAGTDKVTRGVGTTKPTQAEGTTEATQTAGITEATQTAGTDKVTRGVGTTKPTQTEGTTEATQTEGTTEATQTAETDKVTLGVGTTKPTQTEGTTETTQTVGTTEATQTAGTDKVTRGVETIKPTQTDGTTEATQTAGTDKVTRGVGTTKPTQTAGTTEATQTAGITEATQTAGTDKVTRGVGTTKPTQTDGTTEATQTAGTNKVTRGVGTTKPTQTEGTTEATQTAGTTEATQTAGTDKVTRGVGTTKPTQTEETTEATQTAGTDKVTRGIGTTEPTQTDGTTEATQTAGTDKVTRGIGTTKPTQTEGTTEATQTAGTTEATQTAGTDKVTRGIGTTKPTQTEGTTRTSRCHTWSSWINDDKPNTGSGDSELISVLYSKYSLCVSPVAVECRVAITGQDVRASGQRVSCTKKEGLQCINTDNGGKCKDYEIRVFCPCSLTELTSVSSIQSSTFTPSSSDTSSISSSQSYTTSSVLTSTNGPTSTNSPTSTNGHTSTNGLTSRNGPTSTNQPTSTNGSPSQSASTSPSSGVSSSTSGLLIYTSASVPSTSKSSYPTDTTEFSSPASATYRVSTDTSSTSNVFSTSLSNGTSATTLILPENSDTTISSILTSPSSPTTAVPTESTTPSARIVCSWTNWMSDHSPDAYGDMETILQLRHHYSFCNTSDILAVRCRDRKTKKTPEELGQLNVQCEINRGLVCINSNQLLGQCADYEVSFLCDPQSPDCRFQTTTGNPLSTAAGTTEPTTHGETSILLTDSTTESTARDRTSVFTTGSTNESTTSGGISIYTTVSTTESTARGGTSIFTTGSTTESTAHGRTSMFITDSTTESTAHGGTSILTTGSTTESTAHGGTLILTTGSTTKSTAQGGTSILTTGSTTKSTAQGGTSIFTTGSTIQSTAHGGTSVFATDSTIESTARGSTYASSSGTTEQQPKCFPETCKQNVILREDMLSASSFRNAGYAPGRARLGDASCWIPAATDISPHIQINFMTWQLISGITTQGHASVSLFVRTYIIKYSTDGIKWHPYREIKGQDRIFYGNSDATTPVRNLFQHLIHARYLRIIPLSWNHEIALRFQLHGCSQTSYDESYINYSGAAAITPTASAEVTNLYKSVDVSENENCTEWDQWLDLNHPNLTHRDETEPIADLIANSLFCKNPMAIECSPEPFVRPQTSAAMMSCNLWEGFKCLVSDGNGPICNNYKARLGCLRETPECTSRVTDHSPVPVCYPELDTRFCPESCQQGFYCNGTSCVLRSLCPCNINGKIVMPHGVERNENCDICQCQNGEIMCAQMPECPPCAQGISYRDTGSCECQCQTCKADEFQCGDGSCISEDRKCDCIVDCIDDELECDSTKQYTQSYSSVMTTAPVTNSTVTSTTISIQETSNSPTAGIPRCTYIRNFTSDNDSHVPLTEPQVKVYMAGETWTDGLCKHCSCSNVSSIMCTEHYCPPCPLGEERSQTADSCCGRCTPVGCVVDSHVYKAGESLPTSKKCYTAACEKNNDTFMIHETQVYCETKLPYCLPGVSETEAYDITGCCHTCTSPPPTPLPTTVTPSTCKTCSPQLVTENQNDTIGYFKVLQGNITCQNKEPIPDLKQCGGYCGSWFAEMLKASDSSCTCCQPSRTSSRSVQLHCSDGEHLTKYYIVPETCSCMPCSGGI